MKRLLTDSPHFCMIPWIHLHVWPEGVTYPCCFYSMDEPIGSMQDHTLVELWNSEPLRKLRLAMISDQPTPACSRCYELERSGSPSLRSNMNRHFAHHFDRVETTAADGRVEQLNLAYFDVRFSNICNFKCRSCGPDLSSSWYEDAQDGQRRKPKLLHPTRKPEDLWRQIEPLVPSIEEIYFAGGEPLLTDEHYQILKLLIAHGRSSVKIRYNTNFSQMSFRGEDVRQLWNQFDDVSVGASLDAMGPRAEYMRKGTVWAEIEDHRRRMREICPRVRFHISATLSLMNALHFPDFHRAWVESGQITISDLHINLVTFPTHLRVQALPAELKQQMRERYQQHLHDFVAGFGDAGAGATRAFRSALHFVDEADYTAELPAFRDMTRRLDRLRGEDFNAVFPELAALGV
jgi:sulfatase maturation enzyme AslB (radical SAM superfamily)